MTVAVMVTMAKRKIKTVAAAAEKM